jgi:membrane protein implicated in regulation of membrane protease activity
VAIAWIAAGVVLLAFELHHLALYALFAAVGCFAAAIVGVVAPDAIAAQVIAAVLVAVVGIVLVRPRVSAALAARQGGHRTRGVHSGLVGDEVVTVDLVGGVGSVGHVSLAGERWRAISGAEVPLPPGTRVLITGVEGTTLIVWPTDGYLPPLVDGTDVGDLGDLGDLADSNSDTGPLVEDRKQEEP